MGGNAASAEEDSGYRDSGAIIWTVDARNVFIFLAMFKGLVGGKII